MNLTSASFISLPEIDRLFPKILFASSFLIDLRIGGSLIESYTLRLTRARNLSY